jgi:hypothetical protein
MSAAKRREVGKPAGPTRIIDVFLIDRKEAIQAVAQGKVQIEAISINLREFKQWALDTNQPEGTINGVKIVERKGDNQNGKKE